mgnify:CR=1 FL=1
MVSTHGWLSNRTHLEILNTVQIQIRDRDKDNQFETFEHVTVLWVAAAVNNLP